MSVGAPSGALFVFIAAQRCRVGEFRAVKRQVAPNVGYKPDALAAPLDHSQMRRTDEQLDTVTRVGANVMRPLADPVQAGETGPAIRREQTRTTLVAPDLLVRIKGGFVS